MQTITKSKKTSQKWWENTFIYQIYPKSFQDTTNNGIGDINGIIQRLDYLKNLGVEAIWLCPIFDSPFKDNGYDIADYKKISPKFGDNLIFETLIKEAKNRKIKVLMDLVVNHSSNEHLWFKEALKDKNSPFRDYYIFKKGKGKGVPPNKWESIWGGPAWTYNEITDDWYLHYFSAFQPDLNWDNKDLRNEIFEIVRFWMNKGVSGWRLDAITYISKPVNFDDDDSMIKLGPNLHKYLKMLCGVMREFEDPLIVGECSMIPQEDIWKLSSPEREELTMTILFDIVGIDQDYSKGCGRFALRELKAEYINGALKNWYKNIKDGMIALHIQSHDQARILSRWGNEVTRTISGKMLATFNFLLKGTPIIYQGEEIGMINNKFTLSEFDDIEIKSWYKILVEQKKIYTKEQYLEICNKVARDHARTPMQWDSSLYAGFSKSEPWLIMNDTYGEINVEDSMKFENSIFYYYKALIEFRKTEILIHKGEFEILESGEGKMVVYKRFLEGVDYQIYVFCNFFDVESVLEMKDFKYIFDNRYEVIFGNYKTVVMLDSKIFIKPFEAFVIKVY